MPTIDGELRRHQRDRAWPIHVARGLKERYLAVSRAVDELSQALMRSPSVAEIAEQAGTTVEQALEALEVAASYRGVPLIPPESDGDDNGGPTIGREERGFAATEARMVVAELLACLPTERDRILVRRWFFDGCLQSEIAAEVGISQVQVSPTAAGSTSTGRVGSCPATRQHRPQRPVPIAHEQLGFEESMHAMLGGAVGREQRLASLGDLGGHDHEGALGRRR